MKILCTQLSEGKKLVCSLENNVGGGGRRWIGGTPG